MSKGDEDDLTDPVVWRARVDANLFDISVKLAAMNTALLGLDGQGGMVARVESHAQRLMNLEKRDNEREGRMAFLVGVWGLAGALIGAVTTVAAEHFVR